MATKQGGSKRTNWNRNTRKRQATIARKIKRKKMLFLTELRETGGEVLVSADRVGISKGSIYEWRAADPVFAQKWDEAIDLGWGDFKATGFERAKNKSDTLWGMLAKAKWPLEFRERLEHEIKSDETFRMLVNAVGRLIQQFVPKAQQIEAVTFVGELMGAAPRLVRPQVTDQDNGHQEPG